MGKLINVKAHGKALRKNCLSHYPLRGESTLPTSEDWKAKGVENTELAHFDTYVKRFSLLNSLFVNV